MNMKKWLISAVTLTFALGTAGTITAFALTAGGGGPEVQDSTETTGEVLHGDPTYEQWLADHGDEPVATSIDDIDPNVCNAIHNINACSPEELEELGMAPIPDTRVTPIKNSMRIRFSIFLLTTLDVPPYLAGITHIKVSKAPSSTGAMVGRLYNAVNHPIMLTILSVGAMNWRSMGRQRVEMRGWNRTLATPGQRDRIY